MKFLMIIFLGFLSITAHASCMSILNEGIRNFNTGSTAANNYISLIKELDTDNLSDYRQCELKVEFLKSAARATTYYYKARKNGNQILALDCYYSNAANRNTAQAMNSESQINYKVFSSRWEYAEQRLEGLCANLVDIPQIRKPELDD